MSKIVLIKITGKDRPGVTSTVTALLAEFDVSVLDIGQAVIHDNLVLGLLAEIPDTHAETAVKHQGYGLFEALADRLEQLAMEFDYEFVENANYQKWTGEQGKPRHIVTLLARKISAEHVRRVTELVAKHGLNIDKITRLSGRVPVFQVSENGGKNTKACIEFSLRGELPDERRVRNELLELANTLDIDIAYQEDDMFRRNRRLVVFDMDSTLIEAEVIDELAIVAGVGDSVSAITESAMRGEIDFKESFRRRVGLLKGLPESALEEVANSLCLTEGAETLVKTLKRLGYKTAILSGGFTYFGKRIQQQLGFDYVFANELDIVDGVVTGEVKTPIVDGERKAELLKEIAQREGIALEQVIAVGDGANDLPMLGIAGLGVAFRAKPLVKESARQAISNLGLDSILYLLGISDRELMSGKQ